MNFAAWAGVGARAATEVKVGNHLAVTAGAKAKEGNNKKSTSQPIYEQSITKGGEQDATRR